jgi:hypothetical protein
MVRADEGDIATGDSQQPASKRRECASVSDLEVQVFSSTAFRLLANSELAGSMLQTLICPGGPAAASSDGREFVVLANDHLEDVVQRAQLAGLTVAQWGEEG